VIDGGIAVKKHVENVYYAYRALRMPGHHHHKTDTNTNINIGNNYNNYQQNEHQEHLSKLEHYCFRETHAICSPGVSGAPNINVYAETRSLCPALQRLVVRLPILFP